MKEEDRRSHFVYPPPISLAQTQIVFPTMEFREVFPFLIESPLNLKRESELNSLLYMTDLFTSSLRIIQSQLLSDWSQIPGRKIELESI